MSLFEQLEADFARLFREPVNPGDFATPKAAALPSPDATPPPWAAAVREGADL